jgi:diguanylate cyclase (GGDEF)-like protein
VFPKVIYPIILGLSLFLATGLILWLELRTPRFSRLLGDSDLPLGRATRRSATDPVTRLPARQAVIERFQALLRQTRRHRISFGIILVGLNDFDRVCNDFGKPTADHLLAALGKRLVAVTRDTDTVGFMRGSDFAVLMPNPQNGFDAILSKLSKTIEMPVTLPGVAQAITPTASFGTALCPQDGTDWTSVLKAADIRLRRSRCPKAADQTDIYQAPAAIREALATLGLTWPVTPETVKSRYKVLAKRDHPDLNGGSRTAEERLKTVNLAYAAVRAVLEPKPNRRFSGSSVA